MAMWAGIALVMLIVCFARCKETVRFEAARAQKVPLGKNLKALLTNQYFWAVLIL